MRPLALESDLASLVDAAAPIQRASALVDRRSMSRVRSLRAAYAAAPVQSLAVTTGEIRRQRRRSFNRRSARYDQTCCRAVTSCWCTRAPPSPHACLPFRVLCRGLFVVSRLRCLTPRCRHVLEARSGKRVIGAEKAAMAETAMNQRSPTRSRPPLRNGGNRVRANARKHARLNRSA